MPGLGAASEPSMEEILASIRKIIAEDAEGPRLARPEAEPAAPPLPESIAAVTPFATPVEREPDFELPSILRSSPASPQERGPGVLNRLADALLGAQSAPAPAAQNRAVELSRSLEDDLADLLEGASGARGSIANPPIAVPPAQPPPLGGEATVGPKVAAPTPEAQRLFASLDESLAMLSDPRQSRDWLRDLAGRAPLLSVGESGSPVAGAPSGFAAPAPRALSVEPSAGEADGASPPQAIAAMAPPVTPAPPQAPPALSELEIRPRDGESPKPPPVPKAKPVNGAAPREASSAASPPALESAAPSKTEAPTLSTPSAPLSTTRPETLSPSPAAGPSAEALERTRASVISAAEFFINGVAGKSGALLGDQPTHPAPGAGGLDAAAAELLRPMLKQWLAENMPRIVEAALRAEIGKVPDPNRKA